MPRCRYPDTNELSFLFLKETIYTLYTTGTFLYSVDCMSVLEKYNNSCDMFFVVSNLSSRLSLFNCSCFFLGLLLCFLYCDLFLEGVALQN